MVKCSCGKSIEKVPDWMQSIRVEFVCNNCPNRQTKNIALMTAEIENSMRPKMEDELADEDLALEDDAEDLEPA